MTFTPEQIIHIGGLIQKELNHRHSRLLGYSEKLPFSGLEVVQTRNAMDIFMDNFVFEVQKELTTGK